MVFPMTQVTALALEVIRNDWRDELSDVF